MRHSHKNGFPRCWSYHVWRHTQSYLVFKKQEFASPGSAVCKVILMSELWFMESFHSTRCHILMNECVRSDVKDGMGWKCPFCKTRTSLQQGSFFSKSHLTLQKSVMIIHFWSKQNPVGDTAESVDIGKNTAVDVYQWLREVCSTR